MAPESCRKVRGVLLEEQTQASAASRGDVLHVYAPVAKVKSHPAGYRVRLHSGSRVEAGVTWVCVDRLPAQSTVCFVYENNYNQLKCFHMWSPPGRTSREKGRDPLVKELSLGLKITTRRQPDPFGWVGGVDAKCSSSQLSPRWLNYAALERKLFCKRVPLLQGWRG